MSHLAGLSPDELREAVRAVLGEVLGEVLPTEAVPHAGAPSADVTIDTDGDLTAFVRRVAAMCEDAGLRRALQAGEHGFRLAGGGGRAGGSGLQARRAAPQPPHSSAPRPAAVDGVRVERGAVTERVVLQAAADGGRLVLGRRAVLTPLAKDKARTLGVEIEKED